jgi:molybdate/tungstate transport system substrate-binding protein
MKKTILFTALILTAAALTSCGKTAGEKISIFHAGSLSVPMKMLKAEYEKKNPGVEILLEASGSVEAARKITDVGRKCDLMASADYAVIDELLIPAKADFNIIFATNRMAIVFTEKAKYGKEINPDNWPEILLRKDVSYGHSDPDKDPCGYRTMQVWQLAEKYYAKPGLYNSLIAGRPIKNIRPKETDLIALIEGGSLDYIFLYKSVAVQHKLKYIELPDNINLGNASLNNYYSSAKIKIKGKKPGETIEMKGQAMLYGVTMMREPLNRRGAAHFLSFMLSEEGAAVIKNSGQDPVYPPVSAQADKIYSDIKADVTRFK